MKHQPLARVGTVATLVLLVACGGKPKPEGPAPQASTSTSAGTPEPSAPTSGTSGPTAGDATAAAEARRREAASRARAILEQRVFFGFDQAELSPAARETLMAKLEVLKSFPAVNLTVSGHADERGSDEYNLALGNRRANAVKQFLELQGVLNGRMQTTSYGEEQPAVNGHDESAWSQNRRAEFTVTAGLD